MTFRVACRAIILRDLDLRRPSNTLPIIGIVP